MGLVAVAGGVGAAAVGDEHQIVFNQVNGLLLAVLHVDDLLCDLLIAHSLDDDVLDIHAVLHLHAVAFQILYQRKDHALVLVVLGEAQGTEIRQTVDVVDIAAEVTLHFQSAGPALKSEHGLPVEPEVGVPEGIGENVGDLLVLQILFRRQEQLGERHGGLFIQLELLVGMGILAAVHAGAAQGVVGVVLVEPIILVQNGNARTLDGGNIPEGVPHDLKMVVHFPAAAHIEALGDVPVAVATATGQLQLFQQMDALALHLAVSDQIEGGGQTGKAGADDISGFVVYALRLLGMGKRFVSSSRIIHNTNSFAKSFICLSVALLYVRNPLFTINRNASVMKISSRRQKCLKFYQSAGFDAEFPLSTRNRFSAQETSS